MWIMELDVTMDDSAVFRVVADQRDMAKREAHDLMNTLFTGTRFLAWSAMTRQGLTKLDWATFNEKECVDVSAVQDEETDEEPDPSNSTPGQKVASTGPSSPSPALLASRSPK